MNVDWRNQVGAAAAAKTMMAWVTAPVDLIVGFEDQCVSAAKAVTSTIPIVFVQIYDPQAAGPLNLTLVERAAGTEAELTQVFAGLKPGEVDAVIVASPHFQTNHPKLIIKLSEDARMPVVGHREAWVDWGALISYSSDGDSAGPVAARYIDKIFKGAKPGDLRVEEISRTVLAVNFNRARELGLVIPPSIAMRTDHKVE